jgi:hypothetical protein
MNEKDFSAQLPEGEFFQFWEDKTDYKDILYVDTNSQNAHDFNSGTVERPFKTINAAAQIAKPGTKVIIKPGVYRETVVPARGGGSESDMITYEASEGGEVIIKGSVVVNEFRPSKGWRLRSVYDNTPIKAGTKIWEIRIDPENFKGYNPFCAVNIIHDRLFI